ncbi:hypothetical protein [Mechercharimyces sp. CAU 1602]|uniref:hypothetical protein n=1 Tax=Mechercharimyces sp. CAU 1602 TaxID=2973933 RepID=UPI0021615B23|nr:hypothetical protein [Mechercharimyces sp. CAU 1602]MCS1352824.1 hypothetical protein [Mechercharimyces sp. CAU 1602]
MCIPFVYIVLLEGQSLDEEQESLLDIYVETYSGCGSEIVFEYISKEATKGEMDVLISKWSRKQIEDDPNEIDLDITVIFAYPNPYLLGRWSQEVGWVEADGNDKGYFYSYIFQPVSFTEPLPLKWFDPLVTEKWIMIEA